MTDSKSHAWQFVAAGEELKQAEVSQPMPDAGEVLVRNDFAGINPVDWKFIEGNPLNWPAGHIPGVDGAGIIVAVGAGVDASLNGQRVAYHTALARDGSFAHYTRVRAEGFIRVPEGMPLDLAAALPCPLLTAWQAFTKVPAPVQSQEPASIVVAGMGAVNKLLVQYLVTTGYRVDAISGSLTAEEAAALGIHRVYARDSELPAGYHAAFDARGPQQAAELVPHLRANGHIVCIQGRIENPVDEAFSRTISYHEVALGALHEFGDQTAWQDLMQAGERLFRRVAEGSLMVASPEVFTTAAMNDALSHSRKSKQKTVVTFA